MTKWLFMGCSWPERREEEEEESQLKSSCSKASQIDVKKRGPRLGLLGKPTLTSRQVMRSQVFALGSTCIL